MYRPLVARPLSAAWLLVAAALLFVGLSKPPLIDLDEGAFTAATLEMFERGNFLATWLNGEPRYDKPILSYWLQALSAAVLGFNEFALRLPSALMGLTWVGIAYYAARRLYDPATAIAAAFVTATAFGVAVIARLAIADALLDACLAAAVLFQYLWWRDGDARARLIAWAAMGLGVLAKGPVALLIPLATLFLHALSSGRLREFLASLLHWQPWTIFLVIALPWYVAVSWVEGPEFLLTFLLKHNLGRFSGAMGSHHANGAFYYFPILLLLTLPYTGLVLRLVARLRSLWQKDDFARYALIQFGLVFVVFSFSANKLPHYLLYGLCGLFILLGRELLTTRSAWQLLPPLLVCLGALALPTLLAAARDNANAYYQTMLAGLDEHFGLQYHVLAGASAAAIMGVFFVRSLALPQRLAAAALLAVVVLTQLVLPTLGEILQAPIRQAGLVAREQRGPLVMHDLNTPSFAVYAGRAAARGVRRAGDLVLTTHRRLIEIDEYTVLYEERGIVLVRING